MNSTPSIAASIINVLNALPQTQCTRCGYPDCEAYAKAIVLEGIPINQCPPGGEQGIARLSQITGQSVVPLNPVHGFAGPRHTAWIDESACIGCTLCLDACPTDAIVGTNKKMHTVIEKYCTGCELCIPVCPVDCILLENITPDLNGWNAWSESQAVQAKERYQNRTARLEREALEHEERLRAKALEHLQDLEGTTHMPSKQTQQGGIEYAKQVDRKTAIIQAALANAKAKANALKK